MSTDAAASPDEPPPAVSSPVRAFREVGAELLQSLAQHRVLSTGQAHALHTPSSSRQWTRKLLGELRSAGLAQSIRARRRGPEQLWFVTPAGHEALAGAPRGERRAVQVTPEAAAGVLAAHTAALNDAATAFVRAARAHDDECGPLAWRHEVAHPINLAAAEGRRGGENVIADAVLRYSHFTDAGDVELLTWFVELDRATMPLEELVEKLRRYARLARFAADADGTPAWRRLYPISLPGVLLVLAGRDRAALERRRGSVLALAADDPEITDARPALQIRAVLLDDLAGEGPWAPVCVDLADPALYVDAAGHPATA